MTAYQFERVGYFVRDRATRTVAKIAGSNGSGAHEETGSRLVFNRTGPLRDAWKRPGQTVSADRVEAVQTVHGEDTGLHHDREASPALLAAFGDKLTQPD